MCIEFAGKKCKLSIQIKTKHFTKNLKKIFLKWKKMQILDVWALSRWYEAKNEVKKFSNTKFFAGNLAKVNFLEKNQNSIK